MTRQSLAVYGLRHYIRNDTRYCFFVIPAQAGIHLETRLIAPWIPVYAGMTTV